MMKKHQLIILLILVGFIFTISCTSAEPHNNVFATPEFDTDDIDVNKYQLSFVSLYDKLRAVHPSLTPNEYKYVDMEGFNRLSIEVFNHLGEISDDTNNKKLRFAYLTNQLLAKLKDGHTQFEINNHFGGPQSEPLIPIMMKWFKDKLYIVGTIDDNDDLLNKQVLKIGNIDVHKLQDMVNNFISADNDYNKFYLNGFYMCKGIVLEYLGLLDNENKVVIEYLEENETKTVKLEVKEYNSFVYLVNRLQDAGKNEITKYSGTGIIHYKEIPEYKAMYLKLNEFMDSTVEKDNSYYYGVILEDKFNEMFDEIKEKNLEHLVIDLRNNLGGYFHIAYYLLGHIYNDYDEFYSLFSLYKPSKEYYHYIGINPDDYEEEIKSNKLLSGQSLGGPVDADELYEGKVYLLVGNYSFSMASWFAALTKDNNYGVVLGEPTGCGSISHPRGIRMKVSKQNMYVRITPTILIRANEEALKKETDAIYPDVHIPTTFEDYLDGKDPVWDYLVNNYLKE